MSSYSDNNDLLKKIQTGKGDEEIYTRFVNLYPDLFFFGTIPEEIDQDSITGKNDIKIAKAATWTYLTDTGRNPDYEDPMYEYYESKVEQAAIEFSKTSKYIRL